MLEVKVPQDIRKHEDRMFLGLSTKQLTVIGITAGVSIAAFFLTRNLMTVSYVAIAVAFLGFSNINKMLSPLLRFIRIPKQYVFMKTFDLYQELLDEEVSDGDSFGQRTEES